MKIEIKADEALTPDERAQIYDISVAAFPPDDIEWSDHDDWHVLVWEGTEIVTHVEIVERTAMVGGRAVRLGGIGGVVTRPAWRKKGLAETAMQAARDFLHDPLGVAFGLLVCGEELIPYYSRLGWQLLGIPMWIEQSRGRISFPGPIMVLPVCEQDWPEGEIDLKGKPW
jgi:predicted N-acetyltransferase YhbS